MKKLTLLLALCLAFTYANAQLPLSLGVKFGYLSSNLTINDVTSGNFDAFTELSNFSPQKENGYQFGAMARIKFGKIFLQPEAYYAYKKGANSFNVTPLSGTKYKATQEVTLNNLDIPILLSYKLLDLKLAQLNIFTGPMASFAMNKKVVFKNDNDEDISKDFVPEGFESVESAMKAAAWNWQIGAGIDVLMLTLDLRYEMGLNNLTKMDFTQKTNYLTFSIAWRIFG